MLQHFDNGAASKKIDLGLDLIDPWSSFIHILHFTTIMYISYKSIVKCEAS